MLRPKGLIEQHFVCGHERLSGPAGAAQAQCKKEQTVRRALAPICLFTVMHGLIEESEIRTCCTSRQVGLRVRRKGDGAVLERNRFGWPVHLAKCPCLHLERCDIAIIEAQSPGEVVERFLEMTEVPERHTTVDETGDPAGVG